MKNRIAEKKKQIELESDMIYKIKRFNQRTGEVTVEKPKDQFEKFLIESSLPLDV